MTREAPGVPPCNVGCDWRSEHELVPDDKALRADRQELPGRPGAGEMRGRPLTRNAADALNPRVPQGKPPTQDHKPHQIYADASGAAAALASALRFALARALDLRASACSVKAFSRAFSPLSLWIASMSTRLFLYWLPFAAM